MSNPTEEKLKSLLDAGDRVVSFVESGAKYLPGPMGEFASHLGDFVRAAIGIAEDVIAFNHANVPRDPPPPPANPLAGH